MSRRANSAKLSKKYWKMSIGLQVYSSVKLKFLLQMSPPHPVSYGRSVVKIFVRVKLFARFRKKCFLKCCRCAFFLVNKFKTLLSSWKGGCSFVLSIALCILPCIHDVEIALFGWQWLVIMLKASIRVVKKRIGGRDQATWQVNILHALNTYLFYLYGWSLTIAGTWTVSWWTAPSGEVLNCPPRQQLTCFPAWRVIS